jgi:biotin carboxyl carrier protein
MKLQAIINGHETDIIVRREGQRVFADIGDRHYELEFHEPKQGGSLLISNDQVFEVRVEGQLESGKTVNVVVGTSEFAVTLTDPRRLRSAAAVSAHGDAAARIVAPMPGKVVRVLVEVGQNVQAGDGLIVVEAMKMQNEMKAPKAGTVIALNAQTGATVNGGDVLVVVE